MLRNREKKTQHSSLLLEAKKAGTSSCGVSLNSFKRSDAERRLGVLAGLQHWIRLGWTQALAETGEIHWS